MFNNLAHGFRNNTMRDLVTEYNEFKKFYQINEDKIPISKSLSRFLKKYKFKKSNLISNGDDYQVLFTAGVNKSRIIAKISKILRYSVNTIYNYRAGVKNNSIDREDFELFVKKSE